MESGLLNVFHDDHYDGTYKYDVETNYWSEGHDALGLQLTETLQGILPIPPTENKPAYFENGVDFENLNHLEDSDVKFKIKFENYTEDTDNGQYYIDNIENVHSPAIEIISVDPNCDFSSPISCHNDSDDQSDNKSSSRANSRARTESSSIGDYESHTSDESSCDDYKVERNLESGVCTWNGNLFNNINATQEHIQDNMNTDQEYIHDDLILHMKENTAMLQGTEDFTTFAANFDAKDFDLTTFIMQDDCNFPQLPEKNEHTVTNIKIEADSEADIIVDVETVHENDNVFEEVIVDNEINDYNNCFAQLEDDPVKDPSWSPTLRNSKGVKNSKTRNRVSTKNSTTNNKSAVSRLKSTLEKRMCSVVSSKPYSVKNRKKFGLGKGKNISMCSKPETLNSGLKEEPCNKAKEISKNIKDNLDIATKIPVPVEMNKANEDIVKNNITISTREKLILKDVKEEPKENVNNAANSKCLSMESKPNPPLEDIKKEPSEYQIPAKKKLNLEEYKKRRENILIAKNDKPPTNDAERCARNNSCQSESNRKTKDDMIVTMHMPGQPNKQLTMNQSMNQSCKQIKLEKKYYNPIIEAKNKVLRLQELKKAAQTKLIDSTVMAKVGPVTKILPLEEIVKSSSSKKEANEIPLNLNPEYEEIVIVSVSCNTDITLPPTFEEYIKINKDSGTKLLKSTKLLYNISHTLQKAKSSENIKISSSSLISSIQDVVLKKSATVSIKSGGETFQKSPNIGGSPPSEFAPMKQETSKTDICNKKETDTSNSAVEHGEDKVIMHLHKNRVRPKTMTEATQTEILPQFPPLQLILSGTCVKVFSKEKSKQKKQYRSRRVSYSSDESEYRSRSKSRSRSRSPSLKRHKKYSKKRVRYRSRSNSRKRSHRTRSHSKSEGSSASEFEKDRVSRKHRRNRYSTSSSRSESSYTSDNSRSSSLRSDHSYTRSSSRSSSKPRYFAQNSRTDSKRYQRHVSPAVEERRIVYVGRIESETSKEDLKRKFISYGPIRQITLHYKDTGMKYGFVTFEKAQDAFNAIDNGTRDPKIKMYDISFGGRRAFCQAMYSDLDNAAVNGVQLYPYASRNSNEEESFEALLQKVKEKLHNVKSSNTSRSKT